VQATGFSSLSTCARLSRPRRRLPDPAAQIPGQLITRHRDLLSLWEVELLQATGWREDLPVAVLDPSWLRLQRIAVGRLASFLPPDGREAAPELVRFRQLRQSGLDEWSAQLQCWQEFGCDAFQQAQQRFWQSQEQGTGGWTLDCYLNFLSRYRRSLMPGSARRLPLLLLARQGRGEQHQLIWLAPASEPIGHTCE
jgi:hypothetical protein